MNRFVLGVTGGIASGKSTLCNKLAKMGVYVIDADKVSASILKKGTWAYDEVIRAFPKCFICGELNRRALGSIVFSDEEALKKLNNIMHPVIVEQIKQDVLSHSGIICIDAALLYETGLDKLCNKTWCVTAPIKVRIDRIIERDGLSSKEAANRIKSQNEDEYRLSKCDYVFDSSIEQERYDAALKKEIESIFKEINL